MASTVLASMPAYLTMFSLSLPSSPSFSPSSPWYPVLCCHHRHRPRFLSLPTVNHGWIRAESEATFVGRLPSEQSGLGPERLEGIGLEKVGVGAGRDNWGGNGGGGTHVGKRTWNHGHGTGGEGGGEYEDENDGAGGVGFLLHSPDIPTLERSGAKAEITSEGEVGKRTIGERGDEDKGRWEKEKEERRNKPVG
ncbi:hypothetical protein K435DRAFT_858253 [Dendrothele bispora CBS 962.96]|uniref:Uncharacterized protein n=1 Tax=Dendrothele bispora (strain CBS 962.96) TaxID=1314807 RepID=A0A4S8M3G0_DENBC|nr:hypothetical protein K435DRAFT_858253 [Dendrothele bispora CBS 962.96]